MSGGEVRVAVRWQDIDGLGHVNHVNFLIYLEEARDAWLHGHGIRRDEYVVGRCTVHYRREILPDVATVLVRTAVAEVGRSSLTTSQLMLDEDGNVLAEAEFALVMWDPRERRSRPLSDEERRSLEENMEAMR
jgi:acyl-CoA thioester hydrolase